MRRPRGPGGRFLTAEEMAVQRLNEVPHTDVSEGGGVAIDNCATPGPANIQSIPKGEHDGKIADNVAAEGGSPSLGLPNNTFHSHHDDYNYRIRE